MSYRVGEMQWVLISRVLLSKACEAPPQSGMG